MATTFKCKHCGKDNEISEALTSQIQDEILAEERRKHQLEIKEVMQKSEEKAAEKAKADYEQTIKDLKESAGEEKERSNKFLTELSKLNKKLRELERKDEERNLEMQKILVEKEEIIRQESKKKADEENSLEIKSLNKKLEEARKQADEMKRKMQQGSQQTQGEILELEIENLLKENFKFDVIEEVKKGQKGADVKQIVCSNNGTECGLMLWESKNYQEKWSNTWIPKLKKDQREAGAIIGILVSHTFPNNIDTDISLVDGVWVCKPGLIVPLATALRERIYEVAREKAVGHHRGEKVDVLYDYISGNEFRQQIEAIVELYQDMKIQIDKEKRAFDSQWKTREKQLEKYISSMTSICGSVQGIAGQSSIPAFKGLDLLEIESGEH